MSNDNQRLHDRIFNLELERDRLQHHVSMLRYKVKRIYELFETPLEDDNSVINMVETKREIWASWQRR